jgi:hypothetical protein
MIVFCVIAPDRTVSVFTFVVLYFVVFSCRITHHNRTKQRGNGQEQERQRCQDFWTWEQNLGSTTWEEIDRWAVDPGRVPEPAWDSLEQCEEG